MRQKTLTIFKRGGFFQAVILTDAFDGVGFHGLGVLHATNGWQLIRFPCGGLVRVPPAV